MLSQNISLVACLGVPIFSLFIILGYSFTIFIHYSKIILSYSKALFSSFAPPINSLFVVLSDALAVVIILPKESLSSSMPLFGSFFIPVRGLFVVLGNTPGIFHTPTHEKTEHQHHPFRTSSAYPKIHRKKQVDLPHK